MSLNRYKNNAEYVTFVILITNIHFLLILCNVEMWLNNKNFNSSWTLWPQLSISTRTGYVFAGNVATFSVFLRHRDNLEMTLNTGDPKNHGVYTVSNW